MKPTKPTTPNSTLNEGHAADVWWGEHGIDALISPKPYVLRQPEDAAQPDIASTHGEPQ